VIWNDFQIQIHKFSLRSTSKAGEFISVAQKKIAYQYSPLALILWHTTSKWSDRVHSTINLLNSKAAHSQSVTTKVPSSSNLEVEEEGKGRSYLQMEEGRWLLSRSGGGRHRQIDSVRVCGAGGGSM
jgi:hypothetical protein